MSDLCRATTSSPVNISGNFTREFTIALHHLKPGKTPGADFICPELILHAGAALKSWLCGFLSSCLHRLKISKIWRALVVAISKPKKPMEDHKSYRQMSLLCVPYKMLILYSRGLYTPVWNQLLSTPAPYGAGWISTRKFKG